MVVKIFLNSYNASEKDILNFMKKNNIKYELFNINNLDFETFKIFLTNTSCGLEEIFTYRNGLKFLDDNKELTLKQIFEKMGNSKNRYLSNTLITDGNKTMIGYDRQEINMFLPRIQRKIVLEKILNS